MTQIAKTNSPVMTVYATDANMCIAAKDNVTTGGLTMRNIKQKIRANAESICKTCIHSNVCWVIDNQPCIECSQYEPVKRGWWEWFEEWSQSTPDYPEECEDCGWRCSKCKTALEDIVGGYWDDIDEEPMLNYCPNCGAKMDEEAQQ